MDQRVLLSSALSSSVSSEGALEVGCPCFAGWRLRGFYLVTMVVLRCLLFLDCIHSRSVCF